MSRCLRSDRAAKCHPRGAPGLTAPTSKALTTAGEGGMVTSRGPRGSNFRLTEMQSAIAAARTRNALLLAKALVNLSAVRVTLPPEGIERAWYKF